MADSTSKKLARLKAQREAWKRGEDRTPNLQSAAVSAANCIARNAMAGTEEYDRGEKNFQSCPMSVKHMAEKYADTLQNLQLRQTLLKSRQADLSDKLMHTMPTLYREHVKAVDDLSGEVLALDSSIRELIHRRDQKRREIKHSQMCILNIEAERKKAEDESRGLREALEVLKVTEEQVCRVIEGLEGVRRDPAERKSHLSLASPASPRPSSTFELCDFDELPSAWAIDLEARLPEG